MLYLLAIIVSFLLGLTFMDLLGWWGLLPTLVVSFVLCTLALDMQLDDE